MKRGDHGQTPDRRTDTLKPSELKVSSKRLRRGVGGNKAKCCHNASGARCGGYEKGGASATRGFTRPLFAEFLQF